MIDSLARQANMRRILCVGFLGACVGLGLGSPALADDLTLEPSRDATLYQDPGGEYSNGGGDFLFTGRTNSSAVIRRTVLAFDVAGQLPVGAEITAATLTLTVTRGGGTREQRIFRLLADWNEGASQADANEGGGANAQPGDATWISRAFGTSLWTTPGGDFATTPSAVANAGAVNTDVVFSGAGILTDVRDFFANPGANFGWLIRGTVENSRSSKRFGSRNGTAADRPQLALTFNPPLFADNFESGDTTAWSLAIP